MTTQTSCRIARRTIEDPDEKAAAHERFLEKKREDNALVNARYEELKVLRDREQANEDDLRELNKIERSRQNKRDAERARVQNMSPEDRTAYKAKKNKDNKAASKAKTAKKRYLVNKAKKTPLDEAEQLELDTLQAERTRQSEYARGRLQRIKEGESGTEQQQEPTSDPITMTHTSEQQQEPSSDASDTNKMSFSSHPRETITGPLGRLHRFMSSGATSAKSYLVHEMLPAFTGNLQRYRSGAREAGLRGIAQGRMRRPLR